MVAVTGERRSLDKSGGHRRLKQLPIPVSMCCPHNRTWLLTVDDLLDAVLDELKRLPVTACSERIAVVAIPLLAIGIPSARSHFFDEFGRNLIAFNR